MEMALAILGILSVVIPFGIWWYKKRYDTRENLAQAEVDELKDQMDHPRTEPDPTKRLFMDKPKARG